MANVISTYHRRFQCVYILMESFRGGFICKNLYCRRWLMTTYVNKWAIAHHKGINMSASDTKVWNNFDLLPLNIITHHKQINITPNGVFRWVQSCERIIVIMDTVLIGTPGTKMIFKVIMTGLKICWICLGWSLKFSEHSGF